jgi:hypothetical protein
MHGILSLNPGLILLRYKNERREGNATICPIIPPESRGAITLVFDPASRNDTLTTPGEVCVIRCIRPALLRLEISSLQTGLPPLGSIEVEYLS